MDVLYIRSSSYTAYDYCKMKYFISYNLGHSEPPNKKAVLGTVVHKVCEVLANCKLTLQNRPEGKRFSFQDPEIGKVNFTKKTLYSDKFVYDLLNICYDYYIKADTYNDYSYGNFEINKKKYTAYDFCRIMVDTCMELNDGQFDPRNQNIFQPEQPFDLPIEEDWAKIEFEGEEYQLHIKGTIDLIVQLDEKTLELVDYKTGMRLDWATGEVKDFKKLEQDPQLLLYNYAISRLFPDFDQTIISIFFLRDGGPFSMCYEESHKELFLKKLRSRFEEIRADDFPRPRSQNRNDFRCKILCHYLKQKWPGTDRSICHHVEDQLKLYDIGKVSQDLKKEGHFLNKYKAPGEVEE